MPNVTRRELRAFRCLAALVLMALLWPAAETAAQGAATVREYRKVIRTYPFSDPNPIPVVGRIYPYYRFDGYTDTPVDREWTVVELENDYLRVTVLPEIGGKIWSAVEKTTGRSFIYDNHVVKFRDIAMRGPWTSGGIEPNYGIIGHTPNCATPVDYAVSSGPFGARVVIGVLDLLTRTPWRIEITLPPDAAYFTTRSFWYNATPLEQPYYTWMNTGIKAAGNLELIYPGTHYIGHGGEVSPWPIHPENGKNLAFYAQNDFGPYKSYHVLGRGTDVFGAYWHDDDFGMGRYSTRDDKLGKKAWIWGLSRQGMIWEHLLTDTDGQYVEVQSGRLFNQAAEASTFTPFKHRGFEPHSADTWTEYWFPVKGTGGFVDATPRAVLNVIQPGQMRPGANAAAPFTPARQLDVRVFALERIDDTLDVLDGDRVVFSTRLQLAPAATWARALDLRVPAGRLRVRIGTWLDYRAVAGDELSRPLESPAGFDWTSAQGLWLTGKEWIRQRDYVQAQSALEACLKKDPNYLSALADLAMVRYRALDDQGAWDLARRGLAIDAYDPASNYYYGLASARLGRTVDALDGFEVAASSPAYRSAALVELARLHLRRGDLANATAYAEQSLAAGPSNLDALQLRAVLARLRGTDPVAAADRLAAADQPRRTRRAVPQRASGRRPPGFRGRHPQRDAAGDVPRTGRLVSRSRPARRRPGTAASRPAGHGSVVLAGVRPAPAWRRRRGRHAPPGQRRVTTPRVPLPRRERARLRVGARPVGELAAQVLPGAHRLEPQRDGACARPAPRVRVGTRLRPVLRGPGESPRTGRA